MLTRLSLRMMAGIAGAAMCTVLAVSPVYTVKPFSTWSEPENLGEAVNSSYDEFLPELSKDELSLYFSSNRPGPFGGEDVWVSQRASREDPWGPAVNLGAAINTEFNERAPALSRDGHWLFFASTRPGGLGGFDIWVSWRAHTHDDLAWLPPVNLGPGVNGVAGDFGPSHFENDELGVPTLFFASTSARWRRWCRHLSQRAHVERSVRTGCSSCRAEHTAERLPSDDSCRWPGSDSRLQPSRKPSAGSLGVNPCDADRCLVDAGEPRFGRERSVQRFAGRAVTGRQHAGVHVRPRGRLRFRGKRFVHNLAIP